jgi:hypothetical protein
VYDVKQKIMYSIVVLCCCVVLLFELCSQRGNSRVYLHDVSLMYTCVESTHGTRRCVIQFYRGLSVQVFYLYGVFVVQRLGRPGMRSFRPGFRRAAGSSG